MKPVIGTIAFFISSEGTILHVPDSSHISLVIRRPELFGYTRTEMEAIYRRHNEPLGSENKAREEILKEVFRRGWMRLRRYPNQYWSINVHELDDKATGALCDWAKTMLSGQGGFREADHHMPVRIDTPTCRFENHTIADIAAGSLNQKDPVGS